MSNYKRIVSFARKRSSNPKQEAKILQELLPMHSVIVPEDGGMAEKISDICRQSFSKYILEIGFGSGENILNLAKENVDAAYIGCEVFTAGVVKLLKQIKEDGVNNIRIWHDDAVELILRLPNNSLDLVYILHPDPWPKQKHKKRRLINKEFLTLLASKLKINGEVLIITDHKDYAKHITKVVSEVTNIYNQKYENFPPIFKTKYRLKAEALGDQPEYFYLTKKDTIDFLHNPTSAGDLYGDSVLKSSCTSLYNPVFRSESSLNLLPEAGSERSQIKILGIETSCDETSASVVTSDKKILSNIIHSQINNHQEFGGVVPEIASRAHLDYISVVVSEAMKKANLEFKDLDAIAVTSGPGLIGGLLVGIMYAKGLSFSLNKPLLSINHLEGHLLTARLTNDIKFPYLALLVSGGHCQILIAESMGKYTKLGSTIDDAVGEAFDKVAKMLGLPYPGGPIIEKLAQNGDQFAFKFPHPLKGRENCDFSFSGLKTAVRIIIEKTEMNEENVANICASFQRTIAEILIEKLHNAVAIARKKCPEIAQLVIAGGVAANQYLLAKIKAEMATYDIETIAPPIKLCTDNAAMIAWAGIEKFALDSSSETVQVIPKTRWDLSSF